MRYVLLSALLVLGGCADADTSHLRVFAASSLNAPFMQISDTYREQRPDSEVLLTTAGSADLVAQLDQGAPADVLATADEATMAKAQSIRPMTATPFATNTLTIVVPGQNPGGVRDLSDLTDDDLAIAICAPQVPCGAATARVEKAAGIEIAADSEESAVADVLGKISSGQADAGIVYTSDVKNDSSVRAIPIPEAVNTTNTYLIAAVTDQGREFVEAVLSPAGQRTLAENGFGPP